MLSTVTVTASPIIEENRIDAFSSTAAVVSADQMRDQNAVDLPSALRNTPGVEISRYDQVGSYNGNQGGAVYIRGMGASRPGSEIKTYVDGVPVYMGVWSHPLLDLLPMAFTKRAGVKVWISPTTRLLVIDAGSASRADETLTALTQVLPGLSAQLINTAVSPQAAMADWLVSGEQLPQATRSFASSAWIDYEAIDSPTHSNPSSRLELIFAPIRVY